ncbi:hypothetical protein B0H13DRAFT_2367563 [Mycena leptocephala]|nr:hypothetical protein B0H13DRAFT_2367563 [Mycena leptocephala]
MPAPAHHNPDVRRWGGEVFAFTRKSSTRAQLPTTTDNGSTTRRTLNNPQPLPYLDSRPCPYNERHLHINLEHHSHTLDFDAVSYHHEQHRE